VLTNFNISVGITDVFMEALTADDEYDLVNPRNGSVVRRLRARDVMERIVHNAWLSGDPGLFFLDRVNQLDPLAHLPGCAIESCNPCGEIPLSPFNACTLGSINLSNFALPHKGGVDLDRLKHVSKLAVHFLDNVLDQNTYPVEEIHKVTHDHRKIGLGVMGYADLLVRLGIPYGSDDGIRTARLVMETITSATVQASEQLAIKRGPFPLFEQSKWAKAGLPPRRNATTTAIAPTGSISIIAGCSGGCEPLFAICQVRHQAEMKMVDFNADFQAVAEREGFWTEQVRQHVMETGSVQGCPSVPTHWREVFKTANEIDVEWHCKMQAAFQEFVHDAVSKTINLREGATTDDVARTYQLAWDLGCKGITVYRDNSRPLQTLTAGTKMAEDKSDDSVPELYPIPTNTYDMKAASVRTPAGKLSVKLGMDKGRPFEVWLDSSRGGTAVNADTEAIGRLASLVLRLDSPVSPARRIQLIADQLGGIGGGDSIGLGSKKIRSLPDGLANALRRLLKTLHKEPTDSATTLVTPPPAPVAPQNGSNGTTGKNGSNGTQQALTFVSPADICPDCHQVSLVHAEGCDTCNNCGFSRC
jgi:ribonucleoside-diphosphate reductase alpha chain